MSNPQRVGINTNVKQFDTSTSFNPWSFNKASNIITPTIKGANLLIQGDLTILGTIFNPSDINIKENIEILTDVEIDFVSQLKPVKYNYINDSAKKTHFGLVAQEVLKLAPNLVGEIQDDSVSDVPIHTVNYIELIPILLAKMNKMHAELAQLRKDRVKDNIALNQNMHDFFREWNYEWSKQMNRQQVNINNTNADLSKLKRITNRQINNI
jgi:Fe-S cluster assembly iron-binding protein IscA